MCDKINSHGLPQDANQQSFSPSPVLKKIYKVKSGIQAGGGSLLYCFAIQRQSPFLFVSV